MGRNEAEDITPMHEDTRKDTDTKRKAGLSLGLKFWHPRQRAKFASAETTSTMSDTLWIEDSRDQRLHVMSSILDTSS